MEILYNHDKIKQVQSTRDLFQIAIVASRNMFYDWNDP